MEQRLIDTLERIERQKAVNQLRLERGNRPIHPALIPQKHAKSQREMSAGNR